MKKKKKRRVPDERIEMCLCAACASAFYDTPGNRIRRKDPNQLSRDICDFCNYRYGFDYLVSFGNNSVRILNNTPNRTLDKKNGNLYSRGVETNNAMKLTSGTK
ncbi:MAG: hypothetical protein IJU50_09735 [Lachnospiraceae bacterium]|nr:hypothetical protein [Lachnospiraceae bacterium]